MEIGGCQPDRSCRTRPIDWAHRLTTPRKGQLTTALDDLLTRFAALAEEPEPVRSVRGPVLALAQDWLVRLPEGEPKRRALRCLELAGAAASDAYKI